MKLETKPDFEKALERFEAWWQCEIIDRPVVNIWQGSPDPGPGRSMLRLGDCSPRKPDLSYYPDLQ